MTRSVLRGSNPSEAASIFPQVSHHDNGERFVVEADEKLTAFLELESAIRADDAIVLDE